MLSRIFVGDGDIARSVFDAKTAVVEIIVAIRKRQRVVLVDLPLQT